MIPGGKRRVISGRLLNLLVLNHSTVLAAHHIFVLYRHLIIIVFQHVHSIKNFPFMFTSPVDNLGDNESDASDKSFLHISTN